MSFGVNISQQMILWTPNNQYIAMLSKPQMITDVTIVAKIYFT